jgi:hypothetical protein
MLLCILGTDYAATAIAILAAVDPMRTARVSLLMTLSIRIEAVRKGLHTDVGRNLNNSAKLKELSHV